MVQQQQKQHNNSNQQQQKHRDDHHNNNNSNNKSNQQQQQQRRKRGQQQQQEQQQQQGGGGGNKQQQQGNKQQQQQHHGGGGGKHGKQHQPQQATSSSSSSSDTTKTMILSTTTTIQPRIPSKPQQLPPPSSSSSIQQQKLLLLNDHWTYWFDNPKLAPSGSDWKENLKQCGTFCTIEHFWMIHNNLRPPSSIALNSNYSVFRYGIEPSWEDIANVDGGKFVLTIQKKENNNNNNNKNNGTVIKSGGGGGKLDEYWLFTILALIGETMDGNGNQICGAVVSVRKNQDRIALWLRTNSDDGHNRNLCIRIGLRWKKVLNLDNTKINVRYQTHKDAAASGRSFRNEIHFEV